MRAFLYFLFLAYFFSACNNDINSHKQKHDTPVNAKDTHSYANISEIRTTHLHLDLDINFENKTVYGVARHEMSEHSTDKAIFDVKGLEIMKVTTGPNGDNEKPAEYALGNSDEILGAPLQVSINKDIRNINIYYKTTEATEAIDWLPAELTEGKEHPFMYTQGQAILTRSWIPLQDTPMNRITYSADVKVPNELMAIMSASNPKEMSATGEYHFEMKQQIPAYLIALAVGNLTYTSLGNKCGVYTESQIAKAAAWEFVDVPKMMTAAEGLYGDYRWDQYDIVILPYSFPFGGMENPRLTFANPTILAGDRSLVSVIAHELAHSWSGNLVTNATWNDFWLNEGFTVYFETRIMEELYGKEIADILAVIQFQDLEMALEEIGSGDHPEDTKLKLELDGRNPDDGMTDIAYIKGAYFLRTIEKKVGREKFDEFLEAYFDKNAFETITTEDFTAHLKKTLLEPNKVKFNLNEWIYKVGLPTNCVSIDSKRLDFMINMAKFYNDGGNGIASKLKNKKRSDFITQEWLTFIRSLSWKTPIETLKALDDQFEFSNGNAEIQTEWFQLCVRAGHKEARPAIKDYLCKIGRRWHIMNIYKRLIESKDPSDYQFAQDVFEEARSGYHYVSISTIEEILAKRKG